MASEKVRIVSDGSCDLGAEIARSRDITVVPFYVSFDSITYQKEIEELEVREFYRKMVENLLVYLYLLFITSSVNICLILNFYI